MKNLSDKVYVFTLADAIPGQVYRMQTRVEQRTGEQVRPLLEETVTFVGVEQ
jgi:hypothetical protein